MPDEQDVRPDPTAGVPLDSIVAQTKYLSESDAPKNIIDRFWGFFSKEIVLSNYDDRSFRSIKRGILKTKIADRWGRYRDELKGKPGADYLRDNSQLDVNIMARVVRARDGKFQEMITPDFSFRGVQQPMDDMQNRGGGLFGGLKRAILGGQ